MDGGYRITIEGPGFSVTSQTQESEMVEGDDAPSPDSISYTLADALGRANIVRLDYVIANTLLWLVDAYDPFRETDGTPSIDPMLDAARDVVNGWKDHDRILYERAKQRLKRQENSKS